MHPRSSVVLMLMCLLLCGSAEKSEVKVDVAGSWKWSMQRQNGGGREVTGKFKVEGEKLTGTVSGAGFGGGDTEITDGSFKDGKLMFTLKRSRGGMDIVTIYTGKLEGDTIKGKSDTDMRGQKMVRDWEATRVKEEPAKQD